MNHFHVGFWKIFEQKHILAYMDFKVENVSVENLASPCRKL